MTCCWITLMMATICLHSYTLADFRVPVTMPHPSVQTVDYILLNRHNDYHMPGSPLLPDTVL